MKDCGRLDKYDILVKASGRMDPKKQRSLIETLLSILAEVESQLPDEHPRSLIALLRTRVTSALSVYRQYELVDSMLLMTFLRTLSDMYFETKVRSITREELAKSSMREDVKILIVRELHALDLEDHFDYDYIVLFDKLENDMTTLQQIKKIVPEDEYRSIQNVIIGCIAGATDKVLKELQEVNGRLLKAAREELEEKRTVKALESALRKSVREMHTRSLGWPLE